MKMIAYKARLARRIHKLPTRRKTARAFLAGYESMSLGSGTRFPGQTMRERR
ncbi:Hypothetical protein, conserved [Brucella suis ATCC 23445]|uniref:Uncharacterized protein n=1 Tax=Brucella suis (strain ATCC 23445 / NCTC 10510) TaxID=470137 RepID=B0CHS5_BRUSI|nr:Hypothetical protein, conserved [Brucella suis ATCC 23445]